jgi:hypothetical protein
MATIKSYTDIEQSKKYAEILSMLVKGNNGGINYGSIR